MRVDDERHGTYAGPLAHRRDGEQPCQPCLKAQAEYVKAWRQSTGTDWKTQHAARGRALTALAANHRREFKRLYESELGDLRATDVGGRAV